MRDNERFQRKKSKNILKTAGFAFFFFLPFMKIKTHNIHASYKYCIHTSLVNSIYIFKNSEKNIVAYAYICSYIVFCTKRLIHSILSYIEKKSISYNV